MGLLEREQYWINKLQPTLNTYGVVSYKLATPEQLKARKQKLYKGWLSWSRANPDKIRQHNQTNQAKRRARGIKQKSATKIMVCCTICNKDISKREVTRFRHEFTTKHMKYRDELIKKYKTCKPIEIIHFTLE